MYLFVCFVLELLFLSCKNIKGDKFDIEMDFNITGSEERTEVEDPNIILVQLTNIPSNRYQFSHENSNEKEVILE